MCVGDRNAAMGWSCNMFLKTPRMMILLFCVTAHAEEGLVVHFTIKKSAGNAVSTYTNGILQRLSESTTTTFGEYEMRTESHVVGKDQENIVVTLKDLSSGKPIYVGSGAVTLQVGKSETIALHQLAESKFKYELFVDTSYGALPKQGQ
jgi:hypothetical protein